MNLVLIVSDISRMGRAFEFRKARKMKRWAAMSKVFSRLNKDIIVAIREGGNADPETNSRLRAVLQNCRAANMPKDNIERAIKKATCNDSHKAHSLAVFYHVNQLDEYDSTPA